MRTYWGDLHNHNEIGYGKGSLERSYTIARNSLDVFAFTPHGYWPDPPASDPKMVAYHTQAFDRISDAFPAVVEAANRAYAPGRFVTFSGYEWHTLGWGDFVVLFPGDSASLHRAQDVDDLKAFAAAQGAMLIPHHVAYRHGWRGLDWSSLDPALTSLVEGFSEHGNSFERDGPGAMLGHSMGGSMESQTIMAQLRSSRHIGFTAGTDNHYGYPAGHGEGITGIVAPELTREAVWAALRARHTFAATGDRIDARVRSGDAIMGDALPAQARRELAIDVHPLGALDYVEVLKNGRRAGLWPGVEPGPAAGPQLVRVEWGWGRMDSPELTRWRIRLALSNGAILAAYPCFRGGAGSHELVNLVTGRTEREVTIESFTSRLNTRPISGVVLRLEGDAAQLTCEAEAETDAERGACALCLDMPALRVDDYAEKVYARFSSPRLRVSRALAAGAVAWKQTWTDPRPGPRDTYVVKARQRNGETVWTSPLLFA